MTNAPAALSDDLPAKRVALLSWLRPRPCVVAFSGGVDSATLAKALVEAKDAKPLGYFAVSATTTAQERQDALQLAEEVGIDLRVIETNEFSEPRFVENSPRRCYWCKKVRFDAIQQLANEESGGAVAVLDGSNADDALDYRPGAQAAREVGVLSPFAELGITKAEIRALARAWGLSVAEKPSNPCLATRLAYGLALKEPVLRQVESAELVIQEVLKVPTCRARIDAPGILRIELPEDAIGAAASCDVRVQLVPRLRELGFKFVSLDLEGFFTGKNNRILEK